jgi:enterochelin esterase-like enzyme
MIKNRFFLLLATLLCVVSTCACGGDKPTPEFKRYSSGLSMKSSIIKQGSVVTVPYEILLPADYVSNPERRYPVVYMLHGLGDNESSWNGSWMQGENKITYLENHKELEPMIYVFPRGWHYYYSNFYDGSINYMDMFIQEFIPYIDGTYRTLADREHRAVVGYSMGGFGAMVLPMKHPEMFSVSVPLSMSFRTDQQYMTESQEGWNNQWGMIFGGAGESGAGRITEYYKQHCPLYQFVPENKDVLSTVHWFLTCGDNEEQLLVANDALHQLMMQNGYAHEYRVGDGGHSSSYWRAALDEALPYIQHCFAGGGPWTYSNVYVSVPDVQFESDGVFLSRAFKESGSQEGTAIYLVHNGLEQAQVRKMAAVLQGARDSKRFAILPCDLTQQDLEHWISDYATRYLVGGTPASRCAVAVGEAGRQVYALQEEFGSLYFESATLADDPATITPVKGKFYYMGQNDEGACYSQIGALYKACRLLYASKSEITMFEYRCRNYTGDPEMDLLQGMQAMVSCMKY